MKANNDWSASKKQKTKKKKRQESSQRKEEISIISQSRFIKDFVSFIIDSLSQICCSINFINRISSSLVLPKKKKKIDWNTGKSKKETDDPKRHRNNFRYSRHTSPFISTHVIQRVP